MVVYTQTFTDAFALFFQSTQTTSSAVMIAYIVILFPALPLYSSICLLRRLKKGCSQISAADNRNALALWLISPLSDTVNCPGNERRNDIHGLVI